MRALILEREIIVNKTACRVFGVAVFVILISLGAFVRIPLPFTPVPITLQTFFVLLSAAFLGRGLGTLAQLSYIFLGLLGLPVFTGAGSGLLYFAGPTAGYILGFVLAGFFVGTFIKYARATFLPAFALFSAAGLIILLCGCLWLKLILGGPFGKIALIGLVPFVPGDICKAFVAAIIYLGLKSRAKESF